MEPNNDLLRIEKLTRDKDKNFLEKAGGVAGYLISVAPALAVGAVYEEVYKSRGDNSNEASEKAQKVTNTIADAFTDVGEAIAKPVAAALTVLTLGIKP